MTTLLTTNERAALKQQRPCTLWFTGLSGAGKSTLATQVEWELYQLGLHTYLLDGDRVREGLCKDLGFSPAERDENIRRIGATARLFCDAGLVVLVAAISPFREMRAQVRQSFTAGEFIEVFVDAPLDVCEARDPKGLYHRARTGEITQFTGITSVYEPPAAPEIHLHTDQQSPSACATQIITYLRNHGYLLR